MNCKPANKVKINEKNNPKPDTKRTKVSLNIVFTKDYSGDNQTVIHGFKCLGGHPGLNGKWEQYKQ